MNKSSSQIWEEGVFLAVLSIVVLVFMWISDHGFYWICLVGGGCAFLSAQALTFPGYLEGCFKAHLKYRVEVSVTLKNHCPIWEILWKLTQLLGGKPLILFSLSVFPGQASYREPEHQQQKSLCVRLWFRCKKSQIILKCLESWNTPDILWNEML